MRHAMISAAPRFGGTAVCLTYATRWWDWLRLPLVAGQWHRDGLGRLCRLTIVSKEGK